MEEIEYKLKTNNNILISNAIAKLVEVIKKFDQNVKLQECAEFRTLQESCMSSNALLSITACHGMMILAECGVCDFNYILSTIMTTASTTKFQTGVVSALGQLMIMDMKMRINNSPDFSYKNPFNMNSPQHPFITVLMKNKSTWNDLLNEIENIFNNNDELISKHSIEFLRPFLLYVLLKKSCDLEDINRLQIWKLLLKQLLRSDVQQIVLEILSWSDIESPKNCLFISVLCIEVIDRTLLLENSQFYTSLIPYLVSIIPNLLLFGYDPKPSISIVLKVLHKGKPLSDVDRIFMILAESIIISPSVYLEDVILLCDVIVEKEAIHQVAAHAVVSSVLQWMAYSSCLTSSSLKLASKLIKNINIHKDQPFVPTEPQDILFDSVKYFSQRLLKYSHLSAILRDFHKDAMLLDKWLDKLLELNNESYLYDIRIFLYGLFVCDMNKDVSLKILKLLLAALKVNDKMAVGLLTLILYKLSHEANALVQLELLRALPQMAIIKENVPLIVHTLSCLKKGPVSLQCLCIDLQMRLCRIEVRCYPYLQESLAEVSNDKSSDWYKDIVKAVAIRELCLTRPEHHGSELVAHISRLLNRCVDARGAAPSSIALESIGHLCRAGVVDVVSTWRALSPRLNKDKRPQVIVSLCKLFGIIPSLHCESSEYHNLVAEVLQMLWGYVTNFHEKDIIDSALAALSNFSLEDITLKQVPEIFRQNIKLPSSYCKTPQDAARKPEEVLPYIPGECWVQMLQNINHACIEKAGDLISKWMSIEISQYRSGTYIVASGKGEPNDCSSLPQKSIVRAIMEFVMSQATKSTYDCTPAVLNQSLHILSRCYSKPLPPVNWCCLHDLYHRSEDMRCCCVTIATRQMVISGSAKRFIENYLSVFDTQTSSIEEIKNLYNNLPYYCKLIAPNTLRKVIGSTLDFALENALSNSENEKGDILFKHLLAHIKQTLDVADIHDANRTLLAQLVEQLFDKIHHDDELFQNYADCCLELPIIYFDRITSPTIWWESTSAKIRKATVIRCAMASKSVNDEKSLVWLNEIIDIGMTEAYEQTYILNNIVSVIQIRHSKEFDTSNSNWCLELMGQTQAELVKHMDSKSTTAINRNSITFLCDAIMLALVCYSGTICLSVYNLEDFVISRAKFDLFPSAVSALCANEAWTKTMAQIIEWLFHMTLSCVIPGIYIKTFQRALMVSKNHKQFDHKFLWYKIIQESYVKIPIIKNKFNVDLL